MVTAIYVYFPGKEELKRMFEEAGFINVRVRSFTGALLQSPWL